MGKIVLMASCYYSKRNKMYLEHFSNLLQNERKTRNFTIEDLGSRCGVSRKTIAKALCGDPTVKIGIYFEIAVVLNVPLFEQEINRFEELARTTKKYGQLLPMRVRSARIKMDDDF